MWRFLKFIFVSILIVSISFGIYKVNSHYNLNLNYEDIDWAISNKGLDGAVAFDFDGNSNLYIAFNKEIRVITDENREEVILEDEALNIYDIAVYENDNIIIATDNRVIKYNINTKEIDVIINNLPNIGLNFRTKLAINGDYLYVSVGSNTNAGIVDGENKNPDQASFEWISTGVSYENNYAFASIGTKLNEGEKISENIISNGTILRFDLKKYELVTYATGLRNIEGLAFNSEKQLIGIVGGIDNSGARKVLDDVDYIYEIKDKAWYGWPDFSGGDPITSPRFTDGSFKLDFVIANHPSEVPLGPKYQHDKVSALRGIAIDFEGKCLPKNTMIFADNKGKTIYALGGNGIAKEIVSFDDDTYIEEIKYYNSNIYFLDSKTGYLYMLQGQSNVGSFALPRSVWIFVILFIFTITSAVIYKIKNRRCVNK